MHVTTIGTLWTYDHPRKKVPSGTRGKIVRYDTDNGEKIVSVRTELGLVVCAARRVEAST